MAAPGVHDKATAKKNAPKVLDSLSREEPVPVHCSKKISQNSHSGEITGSMESSEEALELDDNTDGKTDMDDATDKDDKTDGKTDMDVKFSNAENSSYVYGAELNTVLPRYVIGNSDPNLHDESMSAKNDSDIEVANSDEQIAGMSEKSDPELANDALNGSDIGETKQKAGLLEKMMTDSPGLSDSGDNSRQIQTDTVEFVGEQSSVGDCDLSQPGASSVKKLPDKEDLCVPEASNLNLPLMKEIFECGLSSAGDNPTSDITQVSRQSSASSNVRLSVVDKPRAPYKGTMVPCGQLKDYLDALPTFNRKCMLRKGREVHKIYVDMMKGETFLDDQFAYTEFGKMVLSNGSIRAGRAKNAKQIVVARETLYCSGTSACKRACGGYGVCLPGCDKTKMRGHRCSYRIKLTQRLGYVNFWFVEELGSHDQLNGKDCDFKVNSEIESNMDSASAKQGPVMDLSNGGFKFRAANIPKSAHKKLAPKSTTSPDRLGKLPKGGPCSSVSDASDKDIPTSYHYVLGSVPNGSPLGNTHHQPTLPNSDSLSSQQQTALGAFVNGNLANPGLLATVPVTTAAELQPDIASQIFQANLLNYMSTMTNLGLSASIQSGTNPVLVSVKQEPLDSNQFPVGQGHIAVGLPLMTLSNQVLYSPSQMINSSHSPSPARSHEHSPSPLGVQSHCHSLSRNQDDVPSPLRNKHYRDRSPLARDPNHNASSIQKGMEIEARIKGESGRKMQAQEDILGQVHSRIMERAKCRKSSHTTRVPQNRDGQVLDFSCSNIEKQLGVSECLNIPMTSSSSVTASSSFGASSHIESNGISSHTYHRFQTLNQVLQSSEFQAAKNRLKVNNEDKKEDESSPLNLVINRQKLAKENHPEESHRQYFKLAEEWKKGQQLTEEYNKGQQLFVDHVDGRKLGENCQEQKKWEKNGNHDNMLNGHVNFLNTTTFIDSDKLTENEKELICRVRQLESHVKQLQNIVIRKDVSTSQPVSGRRKAKPAREIDFNKYNTRHVALKVMYLGGDYQGYASQEDSDKTIEHALFEALKKTKLIESRETCCYNRCGRTDKGVSAFGQVISLDLRSNLLSGVGVKVREGGTAIERPGEKTTEIQYCHILNKNLPAEIRVLAWAPVDPEFNSRFSCKKRTYKYFFPKGNLNIELMDQACRKFIGEHDFRNFCKVNVENTTNHIRKILSVEIKPVGDLDEGGYTMYELTIVGTAFLYHQIRCIVAILFLIGRQQENPEVIDDLLNVEKMPSRPQYNWASEIPLCLYDADFGEDFEWIYEVYWHEDNIKHLQQLWAEHAVKATMLKKMLEDLDRAKVETECDIAPWSDLSPPVLNQAEWIAAEKWKVYKPLRERQVCPTVEEKIENLAKKRKLNPDSEAQPSEQDTD